MDMILNYVTVNKNEEREMEIYNNKQIKTLHLYPLAYAPFEKKIKKKCLFSW